MASIYELARQRIAQRCACCGRMFRKSEMGHVGNEVYKCMTCLMKGRHEKDVCFTMKIYSGSNMTEIHKDLK